MKRKPSKSAIKFLRWFCREDSIEEIEGDLLEIFSKDAMHHPRRAQRYFMYNVLKSFRWRNLKIAHRGISIISWDLFRHYLKLSLRSIRTNPTFSFLNIISITIGLTCCLALLTFSRYEENFDRHYSEFNQIYRIVQHTQYPEKTEFWNTTAYPLAAALRNDFPEAGTVAQTAGPLSYTINIAGNRKTPLRYREDYVLFVDSGYIKIFQPQWLAGIPEDFNSNINCILLTETTARKYFGPDYNPEELLQNEVIQIGETPLELVGIVADPPANSTIRYDVLIPYSFFRNKNEYWAENWSGNYQGTTFIRLNEPKRAGQINQAINHWKKKYLKPEDDQRIEYVLQPLIEMHTDTRYGSSPGSYVISKKMIRLGRLIAIFILLVAILNFINLVSARSGIRLKEISLRKIVGGSRWKLFQQFFLENTLLVCIAVGLSLLAVQYVLVKINESLSMINLDLKIKQDDIWTIIIVGLSAILLTTIYPASILSSFKPVQLLTKQFGSRIKQSFSRKGFILFQFILIHGFVASAIIIYQQMNFFKNSEVGFSSDQIVITPAPDFSKKDPYRNELLKLAEVEKVAYGSGPPMAIDGLSLGTTFRLPHQNELEARDTELKISGAEYFNFYDLKLLSGRPFKENKDVFDEFIINQELLLAMGWTPGEALGKKLKINEGEGTIVGVTENFHNNALKSSVTPCVFTNWKYFHDQAFIKIKGNMPPPFSDIRNIWKENFPQSVFQIKFLDDAIAREYLFENLILKAFVISSLLVVIVGCMGIFGLMTFLTLQKKKEVGIRKVLGASIFQLLNLFNREFLPLILIAFIISFPFVFVFTTKWLENFTYHITISIWMFLLSAFITVGISIFTSTLRTYRAATASPVQTIRED